MVKSKSARRKQSRILDTIKSDFLASLVVVAIVIPESLGLALVAGLPPIAGLYSAFFAPIIFGIFAKTKRLVIGVSSATAAMVAAGASLISSPGGSSYIETVLTLSLLVGVILVFVGLFRISSVVNLISRPVIVGLLSGIGVQLIIMNFPALLGLDVSPGLSGTIQQISSFSGSFNGLTVTIALLVIGLSVIFNKSRIPGELMGIAMSIIFVLIFQAGSYGVKMVGALPNELVFSWDATFQLSTVLTLFPSALAIALIALTQSAILIKMSASEHDEPVNLNRDVWSLGLGNIVSSLTGGFTVNGSPPRTLAADRAGAKTAFVNVWAGLVVGLLILVGGGIFENLPMAALSAIVCVLGFYLINFAEIKKVWLSRMAEFWVLIAALVTTAIFGVMVGVSVAVSISLIERLLRQYRPKDTVLLRDGVLSDWARDRVGSHKLPEQLVIYGFGGPLYFDNVDYFKKRILLTVKRSKNEVWNVVLDASQIDDIDYTAGTELVALSRHFISDGISFGIAHVTPDLQAKLKKFGIIEMIGSDSVFKTLGSAVQAFSESRESILFTFSDLKLPVDDYVIVGGGAMEALGLRRATGVFAVLKDDLYNKYKQDSKWREFDFSGGSKALSKGGISLSKAWYGRSFAQLYKDSVVIKGYRVASIKNLMRIKSRIARRKDKADIDLLTSYLGRAEAHD